jgi:hypothetical protein
MIFVFLNSCFVLFFVFPGISTLVSRVCFLLVFRDINFIHIFILGEGGMFKACCRALCCPVCALTQEGIRSFLSHFLVCSEH